MSRHRLSLRILLLAAALAAVACATDPAGELGYADPLAVDGALDASTRQRIDAYRRFVHERYRVDYRVVVEPILDGDAEGAFERAAAERFRAESIGDDEAGRGLLLWIDPERRAVRVEVGYALEPFLTDLAASRMIGDYLAPWFASGALGPGIEASVEALVDQIRPQLEQFAAEAVDTTGSGGAGAGAELAEEPATPAFATASEAELLRLLVPQADPRSARELELAALRAGIYLSRATLYDPDWRRTAPRGRWRPDRLREIASKWDRPYEIEVEGDRAVAYCVDAPGLGPTLLRLDPEGWVIDATAGARLIVYDFDNDSWYALDGDEPYLPILRRIFDLDRVRLQSGRLAWTLARTR